MIGRIVARLFTRNHGALDRIFKATPLAVTEHGLNLSGIPIFRAMLVEVFQIFE
jgi:hypothetical protein